MTFYHAIEPAEAWLLARYFQHGCGSSITPVTQYTNCRNGSEKQRNYSDRLRFDNTIQHNTTIGLQYNTTHISSWMTANLLTKTEFLLIRLKNQLAKIHNSSLDTSHSARNLGFIFDEHLTFADQITALSKACYYHRSSTSLYTAIPWFVNCLYHCYLYRSLQTWLL